MKIIKNSFVLFLALHTLAACAPIPTKRVVYPRFEGILLNNRIPLKNYTVNFSYTHHDACTDGRNIRYQSVKTDDEGKFTISEKLGWSLFRWAVPMDGFEHYNLCIVSPSGEKRWFFGSDFRSPYRAANKKLECDHSSLSNKPKSLDGKISFNEEGCFIINQ